MNLKRILNLAAAIAAVAAASAVCVVAASFVIYALARAYVGPAGGAAAVAAVFALVAVVVAWLARHKAAPKTKPGGAPAGDDSLVGRLIDMARERPLIALGATAAAVTVLIRNPAVITAVVSAFVAGNTTAPPKK